jgi:hypothetical protein
MNINQIAKAIAPLINLVHAEEAVKLAELKRAMHTEQLEAKRALKYMAAQRDKWKDTARKYREQCIMFRTEQRKNK